MSIPFTQFKRPNGRQVPVTIDRPQAIESKARVLLKSGCLFEIEELMTGMVSMEVMRGEQSIAGELCGNGPEVPLCVDRMIEAAYAIVQQQEATP